MISFVLGVVSNPPLHIFVGRRTEIKQQLQDEYGCELLGESSCFLNVSHLSLDWYLSFIFHNAFWGSMRGSPAELCADKPANVR